MNYLFDTHALITLFHNEPGYEIVQSIFEEREWKGRWLYLHHSTN